MVFYRSEDNGNGPVCQEGNQVELPEGKWNGLGGVIHGSKDIVNNPSSV